MNLENRDRFSIVYSYRTGQWCVVDHELEVRYPFAVNSEGALLFVASTSNEEPIRKGDYTLAQGITTEASKL